MKQSPNDRGNRMAAIPKSLKKMNELAEEKFLAKKFNDTFLHWDCINLLMHDRTVKKL